MSDIALIRRASNAMYHAAAAAGPSHRPRVRFAARGGLAFSHPFGGSKGDAGRGPTRTSRVPRACDILSNCSVCLQREVRKMIDANPIPCSSPASAPPPAVPPVGVVPLDRFRKAFPGRNEGELRDIREEFYLLAGLVIDIIQEQGATPPHDQADPGRSAG